MGKEDRIMGFRSKKAPKTKEGTDFPVVKGI